MRQTNVNRTLNLNFLLIYLTLSYHYWLMMAFSVVYFEDRVAWNQTFTVLSFLSIMYRRNKLVFKIWDRSCNDFDLEVSIWQHNNYFNPYTLTVVIFFVEWKIVYANSFLIIQSKVSTEFYIIIIVVRQAYVHIYIYACRSRTTHKKSNIRILLIRQLLSVTYLFVPVFLSNKTNNTRE